jgi:hypothetical protein
VLRISAQSSETGAESIYPSVSIDNGKRTIRTTPTV